jgi:hypothetical protein
MKEKQTAINQVTGAGKWFATTSLNEAMEKGNVQIFQKLLEQGANHLCINDSKGRRKSVNIFKSRETSLLHEVVKINWVNLDLVKFIIKQNRRHLFKIDSEGYLPLTRAFEMLGNPGREKRDNEDWQQFLEYLAHHQLVIETLVQEMRKINARKIRRENHGRRQKN